MEIRKLLVANRGEIAARIFATCRRLAVETVAVVAPDDAGAFHTRRADDVRAIASYLDTADVVRAAREAGADAVHPGYGFLAENAQFAEICEACNIKFIGPSASVIKMMGDKVEARRAMTKA
nr:biotin carboxylase [Actinomycetota bacterium]